MCTIIAFHRVHPRFPLLIAANRDELYARPATTPQRLWEGSPRAIGGIDLVKGGTWMGATEGGLFVGITNQRTLRGPNQRLRSRGEVVKNALASGSVDAVDALLRALDGREYNGFNLLYGDTLDLRVAYAREDRQEVEIVTLPPGLTILANDRIDATAFFGWKTAHVRALAEPLTTAPWEALARELPRILADHELPPIDQVIEPPPGSRFDRELVRQTMAICIHTPNYGTCSATIIAIAKTGVEHYLFAPGAPCGGASFAEHVGLLSTEAATPPPNTR